MKATVAAIIRVLSAVADALDRWRRRLEAKQHEKESRQIESDPAGWFGDHFNGDANGVRRDVPDDASQASHADTAKPSRD